MYVTYNILFRICIQFLIESKYNTYQKITVPVWHVIPLAVLGEIIDFRDAIILSSLSVIDMAGCMVDCVLINVLSTSGVIDSLMITDDNKLAIMCAPVIYI